MLKVLLFNFLFLLHPVHVSLTTVSQKADSDTMEIFFRMYYDDFLRDFSLYAPEFKIRKSTNDNSAIPREMLNNYFNDRVRVYINHKLLSGQLTDFSVDSYEIHMKIVYHSVGKPRVFKIRNQILTGIYKDQANMVYLKINRYENALRLTVDEDEKSISLK